MAFSREMLNDEEEVVLDLNPHWIFFVRPLVALAVATIVGLAMVFAWDGAPGWLTGFIGIAVLAGLVWFGITYAQWSTTNFVLTTDRLIYRHGMLAKRGIEIPLDRVNTVFFSQRLVERMLGCGNLTIESAGEQGRQEFHDVRKPLAVQNEIYRQMEANENRKFDRVGANQAHPPGPSIPDQIRALDELRQTGALSEAEFQAKKADLLDRM